MLSNEPPITVLYCSPGLHDLYLLLQLEEDQQQGPVWQLPASVSLPRSVVASSCVLAWFWGYCGDLQLPRSIDRPVELVERTWNRETRHVVVEIAGLNDCAGSGAVNPGQANTRRIKGVVAVEYTRQMDGRNKGGDS